MSRGLMSRRVYESGSRRKKSLILRLSDSPILRLTLFDKRESTEPGNTGFFDPIDARRLGKDKLTVDFGNEYIVPSPIK